MSYTYKYPRPALTADAVVFAKDGDCFKVLLVERKYAPCKGCWAFPGGFMNMNETTEQAARRELYEETGIKVGAMRQVGAYSKVDRDPRGRVITVAYAAVTDHPLPAKGADDAARAQWIDIRALPALAFDHDEILRDAARLMAIDGLSPTNSPSNNQ